VNPEDILGSAFGKHFEEWRDKWLKSLRYNFLIINSTSLISIDTCNLPYFVHIDLLAVAEHARGKGLGSALINEVKRIFNKPIRAYCEEHNVAFYKKLGFVVKSTRMYPHGTKLFVMHKP